MTTVRDSSSGANLAVRLAAMADDLRRKRTEVEEQRKELSLLIKQTAQELDRVSLRAREAASQLKQVEANLGGIPQPQIKRAYSSVQEAQMRQFMMQTQLEHQRSRLTNLDATEESLRQLIDLADALAEISAEQPGTAASSPTDPVHATQPAHTLDAARLTFRSTELALQRLSHQLHDETAQCLSDMVLRAEICERLVDLDKQRAKAEIARLRQLASGALMATRHLVQELRSPALEETGLASALRRYAEALKTTGKLQVDLQVLGLDKPLPQPVEIAAFRIVQEALSNVARHSGTTRADVRVRYDQQRLVATVADEGNGFDVEKALQEARRREHSGLSEMEHRAELVGGALEISSKPGSGCMISMSIPA